MVFLGEKSFFWVKKSGSGTVHRHFVEFEIFFELEKFYRVSTGFQRVRIFLIELRLVFSELGFGELRTSFSELGFILTEFGLIFWRVRNFLSSYDC